MQVCPAFVITYSVRGGAVIAFVVFWCCNPIQGQVWTADSGHAERACRAGNSAQTAERARRACVTLNLVMKLNCGMPSQDPTFKDDHGSFRFAPVGVLLSRREYSGPNNSLILPSPAPPSSIVVSFRSAFVSPDLSAFAQVFV